MMVIKTILFLFVAAVIIKEIWRQIHKEESDETYESLEVRVKKICLNADLQIKVIPGNKERYFISSGGKNLILTTESYYLGNYRTQKFSPGCPVRCISKYDINELIESSWAGDFLFDSKTEVLMFIAKKFAGYENYSDTTEIHLGKVDKSKESEDVMKLKETEIISKMIEAEKSGDKELELKMLDKWESEFKIKSDE